MTQRMTALAMVALVRALPRGPAGAEAMALELRRLETNLTVASQ